ncbi:MAG TPA: TlpA disulfide reductase family protein [Acidimicrobiales bacterium]|nr:TlpA disulfide reductase family protein [Acidimicrobiales bacterium]
MIAPAPPAAGEPAPGPRDPFRRRVVTLVVGVVVVALVLVGLTVGGGPGPDARAAAFSLPRLGGGTRVGFPLAGDDAHHPVVLTFFASWCGPCHRDLPVVAAVARAAAARHSPVVFLGIDGNDGTAAGLAFARASGVGFAVGADSGSVVAPRYTLVGYPGTVFIDRAGDVVHTVQGPVSRATLSTWLDRIAGSPA